jgi:hypothetical protein
MTDLITTAVGQVIDRIVAMEKLAVTDATTATKREIYWGATPPFWTNAFVAFSNPKPSRYALTLEPRLVVSHLSQATAVDSTSLTPQDHVWVYVADTVRYFTAHRQLQLTGYSEIKYLDAPGLTITANSRLMIFSLPGQSYTALYIPFSITVPFLIYD